MPAGECNCNYSPNDTVTLTVLVIRMPAGECNCNCQWCDIGNHCNNAQSG